MALRGALQRQIAKLHGRRGPQRRVVRGNQGNQQAAAHTGLITSSGPVNSRLRTTGQKKLVILVRIAFTTTDEGEQSSSSSYRALHGKLAASVTDSTMFSASIPE